MRWTFPIRGTYHRGPEAEDALDVAAAANSKIRLEPEPTNIHDPQAIKVYIAADNIWVGYVGKEHCGILLKLISLHGSELNCSVSPSADLLVEVEPIS